MFQQEQTPGSNPDAIGFLALPIAFGVRNAGYLLTLFNTIFCGFIGYALWQAP
ncbi:MAG: hypothetical protein QNJ41_10065 [Xenococcaceae cyanobacterium MO_188.B32]|nr:hypothetical protein [Xenococcaceae cyanobacterium MO_188.B32]